MYRNPDSAETGNPCSASHMCKGGGHRVVNIFVQTGDGAGSGLVLLQAATEKSLPALFLWASMVNLLCIIGRNSR